MKSGVPSRDCQCNVVTSRGDFAQDLTSLSVESAHLSDMGYQAPTEAPKKGYGTGGLLKGRYMLSVTANAPQEAFNDDMETYFAGRSEDDLLLPIHLNFKWLGLEKIPPFWAYDVMKNPQIESDFAHFDAH